MTEQNKEITLDEALKRIDQLEAQNAALRGGGKINREAKNSVFLDLFGRKAYPEIFRICEEEGILTEYLKEHKSEVEKIMMTMVSPEYVKKTTERTAKIRSSIEALREMHHSESEILDYLVTKFGISEEYAQNCLEAEWDEDGVIA